MKKLFILIFYGIFILGCMPSKQPGELVNKNDDVISGKPFYLYLGQGFVGDEVIVQIGDVMIYVNNPITGSNGLAAYIPFSPRRLTRVNVDVPAKNLSMSHTAKIRDGQVILMSITNNHFEIETYHRKDWRLRPLQ